MLGIGVDIVSVDRAKETIERSGDIFLNRVFTENERRNYSDCGNEAIYYAKLFAGKEGVFKAFSTKWTEEMEWHDIEIIKGEYGEPRAVLHGYLKELFIQKGGTKILLSISWEIDMVIAYAGFV